jgi:transcription antitermination factor NusG
MEAASVYCLFCETSRENRAEAFLKGLGYGVISASVERIVVKKGKAAREFRPIIPGYVFFENDYEPDWDAICGSKYIYYPLRYADNDKRLKGRDLSFVRWLKGNGGVINVLKVMEAGKKIKIIEGPAAGLGGEIVKVNRRQKCVGVKVEGDGIRNIIWLSYECVE